MDMENVVKIQTRQELRTWLETHSTSKRYCWVITDSTKGTHSVPYLDIVEEALCFGWIDGTKKKLSDTESAQRLSPRTKKSHWTELNKERVRRLIRLDLMTEEGLKVLPDMRLESFVIDKEIERRLKEDQEVYQNFLNFPELYRRIRIDTIQSYKHDSQLFNNRLDKFIENTRNNKQYGQWNDKGSLLED